VIGSPSNSKVEIFPSAFDTMPRHLRNLSVSLLEGSRTSDLREFSKFRDFSENRSVLFLSALVTATEIRDTTKFES
jgi:hypothetical protein